MKNSAREEYKTRNFDLIPLKIFFALFSQVGNKSIREWRTGQFCCFSV